MLCVRMEKYSYMYFTLLALLIPPPPPPHLCTMLRIKGTVSREKFSN